MIWGLLGETGDGKTEYLAYMGYQSHLAGSIVHANFKLKYKYNPITTIEELKEIPLGGQRIILLDEVWMSGDAFESGNKQVRLLTQFILQARKKHADVIHTNQHESQVVKRIRVNTSLYLKPRITLSYHEASKTFTNDPPHPNKGIVPFMMSVRFYDKFFNYLKYDEPFMVYPAHIYYDTLEEVKQLRTVNYERIAKKHERFEGSAIALADVLERKEGLTKSDAKGFARYLMTMRANEYLNEFKEKHKNDIDKKK